MRCSPLNRALCFVNKYGVHMKTPKVDVGQWIVIGEATNAYVLSVTSDTELEVGYLQNSVKAIKEAVIFDGDRWKFKYSGPCGSYLRGRDASIVKHGPQ